MASPLIAITMGIGREHTHTRKVAAGPIEAGDQTLPDGIAARAENNWDRSGRRLCRNCRHSTADRGDDGHLAANQISGQRRQPLIFTPRPAEFDRYVLAIDMTRLAQPLAERRNHVCRLGG
jgi:hypothetical protein